jgi:hypothetical protein
MLEFENLHYCGNSYPGWFGKNCNLEVFPHCKILQLQFQCSQWAIVPFISYCKSLLPTLIIEYMRDFSSEKAVKTLRNKNEILMKSLLFLSCHFRTVLAKDVTIPVCCWNTVFLGCQFVLWKEMKVTSGLLCVKP